MKITHQDIGRDVICKNGKEGRIFYSDLNNKQLIVIVELRELNNIVWTQSARINSEGQAINKDYDEYSIVKFLEKGE